MHLHEALWTNQDMLGFARLNRGKIISEVMPLVFSNKIVPQPTEFSLHAYEQVQIEVSPYHRDGSHGPQVSPKRWRRFVQQLGLQKCTSKGI